MEKNKDGHYETAIPFKKDQVYLPDNIRVAKEQLSSLRNKLQRNKRLHDLYSKFVSDLVIKVLGITNHISYHIVYHIKYSKYGDETCISSFCILSHLFRSTAASCKKL